RYPLDYFEAWVRSLAWRSVSLLGGLLFSLQPAEPLWAAPTLLGMTLAAVAMAEAARAFRRWHWPRQWAAALSLLCLGTGGSLALSGAAVGTLLFPGFVALTLAQALVAWAFYPAGQEERSLGRALVSAFAALWVLESLSYPLLILYFLPGVAPLLLASGLLVLLAGTGMIIWLFEQSLSRAEQLGRELQQRNTEMFAALQDLAESRSQTAIYTTIAREQAALVRQILHDLRNAHQAMQFIAESLADETASEPRAQTLLRALERQLTFVSSFLKEKLGRLMDPSGTRLVGTPLAPVFESLAATFEPILRTKGQRLEIDLPQTPCHLRLSAIELDQILGNLIRNAHQHAGPGVLVRLWVEAGDGWATLYVEDDGVGMPWEVQARLGRSAPRPDGSGMGLLNVDELVTRAGGAFGVVSEPARGSTFHVRLPTLTWGGAEREVSVEKSAPSGK
ncbi:MAG: HAMP domain-containing sensor histidine kinase, partial [Candidatus Sericytochromatia bacterium]|nr:HAMP domain-containing sensor histidine kinase [Candidatus Sericytochromatia bacterium]